MKLWVLGGVVLIACSSEDQPAPKPQVPEPMAQEIAAPTMLPAEQAVAQEPIVAEEVVAEAPPPEPAKDDVAPATGVLASKALQQRGSFPSLAKAGDLPSAFDDKLLGRGPLGDEPGESGGGFGRGNSASSAPGTTGGIGFGHGAEPPGHARGGMRGPTASASQLLLGQPSCVGELDKAIVRRYIKRQSARLSYCYERQLLATPRIEGTVNAHFIISEDGTVATAQATGVHDEVSSCIAAVLKSVQFAKPKQGGVACSYPLTFRPSGG
jgi:hypothetical protein